jgi:hypothetical protein
MSGRKVAAAMAVLSSASDLIEAEKKREYGVSRPINDCGCLAADRLVSGNPIPLDQPEAYPSGAFLAALHPIPAIRH